MRHARAPGHVSESTVEATAVPVQSLRFLTTSLTATPPPRVTDAPAWRAAHRVFSRATMALT
jgi:hypothetical protein